MVDYTETAQDMADSRSEFRIKDTIRKFDYYKTHEGHGFDDLAAAEASAMQSEKRFKAHEELVFHAVAKVVEDKGAQLFQNASVEQIERRVRDELVKNGVLFEKQYSDGSKELKFKDEIFYSKYDTPLYLAATGLAQNKFLKDIEKLPITQKGKLKEQFFEAAWDENGKSIGGTGQAAFAAAKLEEFDKAAKSNNQTRTAAVERGDTITTYNPSSLKDGMYQDMQHFVKQADGNYAQVSHATFIEHCKGSMAQTKPIEMKTYGDEAGHFAVKLNDGTPIHLNANTGKQYSAQQLAQLSTNKAFESYQQAGQQVMSATMKRVNE